MMTLDYKEIKILVERAMLEDDVAVQEIYTQLYPTLLQMATQIMKDPYEAQDMVQEAFSIIFSKLDKVPSSQYFVPWCKRVLTNYCLRYMETPQDMPMENLEVYLTNKESAHKDPLLGVLDSERKDLLFAKIDAIDPILSATLELRYYHHYKVSEIAVAMNCPEGTVKSRLNRAKKVVREIIERDGSLLGVFGVVLPASMLINKSTVHASGSNILGGMIHASGDTLEKSSVRQLASSHALATPITFATVGAVALGSSLVVGAGIENYDSVTTVSPEADTVIDSSVVDTTVPLLLNYQLEDGDVLLTMTDDMSGIDYDSIYAVTDNGEIIYPSDMDTSAGCITFAIPDSDFVVYVGDIAGNVSHTQMRLK